MSISNSISIIDVPEKQLNGKNIPNEGSKAEKPVDFEAAITATGYGKFHYLLFLAIIPASWASSFDTANMSMILPSAECDLHLTLFHKGVLNAVVYVGMVLSGFIWGYFADVHGRRNLIVYGYLADGLCNFFSGFSPNFYTLVVFKFVSGFIVSGPYASLMTYVSEFYNARSRKRVSLIVGFSVAFGCIMNAALAWLVIPQNWSIVLFNGAFVYNSWRIFLSLCGFPSILGIIMIWFFPESPKFLMSQGRNDEAMEVFRQIYSMNTGNPKETYPIQVLEDETMGQGSAEVSCEKRKPTASFQDGIRQMKTIFYYPYLSRLILVVTMQFGGMLGTNTIRLWQPQLFAIMDNFDSFTYNMTSEPGFCDIMDLSTKASAEEATRAATQELYTCTNTFVADSVYIDSIVVATTSNVFILLASVVVNLLNLKKLLLIGYGVSLLCVISMIWSSHMLITLVLTCFFVGMMSTTINVVISAAVVLFPTSLRTMAVSLEMIVGRSGTIVGNLMFPILLAQGCVAPIMALAAFVSMCVIVACFLPDPDKDGK